MFYTHLPLSYCCKFVNVLRDLQNIKESNQELDLFAFKVNSYYHAQCSFSCVLCTVHFKVPIPLLLLMALSLFVSPELLIIARGFNH